MTRNAPINNQAATYSANNTQAAAITQATANRAWLAIFMRSSPLQLVMIFAMLFFLAIFIYWGSIIPKIKIKNLVIN